MSMPTDVSVGEDGKVYVVDGVNNRIVIYDKNGKFLLCFGSKGQSPGKFNTPLGISIGKKGLVYIADTGNRRIQIFTPLGQFVKEIGVEKNGTGRLPDIVDVAVDTNENILYLCDNDNHRILVYREPGGGFIKSLGSLGKSRMMFRYPFLMAIAEGGYLLVTETINTRVQVINNKGIFVSFIGNWGVDEGKLYRPKSVAAMGERVFVTDSYLGRVQAFTLRGKYLGILSDSKGNPLKLNTPVGIAADPIRKRLYIVELKPGSVRSIQIE